MWSAIKARLTGRTTGPSTAPAESGSPTAASGPAGVPFTESWLGKGLKESTIDEVLDDLELVLLQSDVAVPVVDRIRTDLKRDLSGRKLRWGADTEEAVRRSLAHSVRSVLDRPKPDLLALIRSRRPEPYVILFVGVNGSGKTTTIAKLAGWLRGQQFGVVIAAGDTFRAGAIEQLLVHGERLGVKVVRQQEGSDPAAVAFDAIQHAKARKLDVVLIDTAGRQHTNENLLSEAKKIRRVAKPDLTIFVGDALSGNDVVEQAKLFTEALGVDALILTKLDADVKGGAALSAVQATGRPLLFVGMGQGYQDLRPFDVDWMVARLFAEDAPPLTATLDVVLVRPKEDGNVGAVARVARNFGADRLILVSPKASLGPEALRRAMGGRKLLESAILAEHLEDAVDMADLVVGTTDLSTGRSTAYLRRSVSPERLGEIILRMEGRVALVFGPEDNGLGVAQLHRCDLLVHIPSRREFPTLNLSHAVGIVLYALHRAKGPDATETTPAPEPIRLNGREKEIFLEPLDELLARTGYPKHKRRGMVLLWRRVMGRSAPTESEYRMMLGFFRAINRTMSRSTHGG